MIARLLDDRLDMVVARRVQQNAAAYRLGHQTGNRLLTGFVASVFRATFTDILSGYRVFSRRFVKSFPVLSRGFRDRDRADRACARTRTGGGRESRRLLCAAGGIGLEAEHLARRFPHPVDHRRPLPLERPLAFFSAVGIALGFVSIGLAIRSSSPNLGSAPSRAFRPRFSRPG